MLKITSFKIDNQSGTIVTDEKQPVFAFTTESDRSDNRLNTAIIRVFDAEQKEKEPFWEKSTKKQSGIRYQGRVLEPLHRYSAELKVTDRFGESASHCIFFKTGKMGSPWAGSWITAGDYVFKEKKISPIPMTFRRRLVFEKKIKRARVFSSALGIYELEINGEKVGRDYFTPGFTSYHHQIQYQVYDVTEMLTAVNEIRAVVAGGWAVGSYTYFRRNRVYAEKQAFLMDLEIEWEDGTHTVIGTDGSWKVTLEGKVLEADLYDGEVFDATVDENKVSWQKASLFEPGFVPNLIAQYGAPVRAHEELHPVSVSKAPSGEIIYDMGQNFAGVVKAGISGTDGQTVIFRHAEILMNGELYTEPLRSAKARAVYTCTGGKQVYTPGFTYMGFRYIGVSGIAQEDIEISALALYSDAEETGDFTCSNEMLNRLQSTIKWGAKSNFTDIPTDCPQRDERLGGTGDIALFSPTACYNFDMSRFLGKWLRDVKAEQGRGGGIPTIVPQVKIYNQYEMSLIMAIDHWGDCCIWVPWAEYIARGDRTLLAKMYPTMKRYIRACCKWAGTTPEKGTGKVWKLGHHYGDWCALDTGFHGWMRRGKWTATAALGYSAALMADIAEILNRNEDAVMYRKLSRNMAKVYRDKLLDADCKVKGFREKNKETGKVLTEFPTAYVLPLYYGLLEGEDKEKAAANLVRLVRANGHHVTTGFPGTPYILFALMDNGYEKDAYKMLLTDTYPSWLYEIKVGGTTTWERWDALREDGTCNTGDGAGMVSFNHYAAGSVGSFLYRRVLGIEPLEGGYKRFRIAPKPGGGLTFASGHTDCAYGRINVSWEISTDGVLTLRTDIPMSTQAVIELPDGTMRKAGSGKQEYSCRLSGKQRS